MQGEGEERGDDKPPRRRKYRSRTYRWKRSSEGGDQPPQGEDGPPVSDFVTTVVWK